MQLETLRLVTDHLGRGDLGKADGVNAHLAAMSLDGSDPAPTPLAAIYDESRDEWVASRDEPPKQPALYVTMDVGPDLPGEVQTIVRDGQLAVAIRYVTNAEYDRKDAVRESSYVLKAVRRSLRALAEASSAARTRNEVCLISLNGITEVPVAEAVGQYEVVGAVLLELTARDANP